MPLVLDATIAGAASNSWVDMTTAQAIIDETPNADAWTAATSTLRTQALVSSCRMLSTVAWRGTKTTTTQALPWPRYFVLDPDAGATASGFTGWTGVGFYLDSSTIPDRVRRAQVALALEILRASPSLSSATGSDVWGRDESLEKKTVRVDVLSTEYVERSARRIGLRQYPQVWRLIYPLTLASDSLRVERA